MKHRIAFLIASNDLSESPHSALAVKFCDLASSNDCVVDIILDDNPPTSATTNGLIISPPAPQSREGHEAAFQTNPGVNLESSADFRKALMLAFQSNLYDLIVLNNYEAFLGAYALDFARFIPFVYWDHAEHKTNPTYQQLINSVKRTDHVIAIEGSDRSYQDTWEPWAKIISDFPRPESRSNTAKVNTWQEGYVADFIKTLGRYASTEDIISILNNRHKFNIHYTTDGTWLEHKNKQAVEVDEDPLFLFPARQSR